MLATYSRYLFPALLVLFQCCATSVRAADVALANTTVKPQAPEVTHAECLDKGKLSNKLSPFELYKSIASCITEENFEPAVFMYAMAGTFGRFDTLRVADRSAHQAAKVLPMLTFDALPKEKVSVFKARVQQTLGDDSIRGKYCAEIESIGPPDYFPSYMVQHGLGAFTGASNNQPLVASFDPNTGWKQAVIGYLQCPHAQ